jgi:hypothetical protein
MRCRNFIVPMILSGLLMFSACTDTRISIADGDADLTCESDEECSGGWICEDGICVDPGGVDGDPADGDVPDGDGVDGDWPDGDVPLNCNELGGQCAPDGSCPAGTRASFSAAGCKGQSPICCMPIQPIACEQNSGFCMPLSEVGCGEGPFVPAESSQGCENLFGRCCLREEIACGALGDVVDKGGNCCEGLIAVEASVPFQQYYPNEGCEPLNADCPDCRICTRCGNGVCGKAENFCNCATDCPSPFGECQSDSDCLAPFCLDDPQSGGGCTQYLPYCSGSSCNLWGETYSNSFCAGGTCMPNDCEPGDTAPFTCWDGSQVDVCTCDTGKWICTDAIDSLCPPEPQCSVGQITEYQCENGPSVTWCTCERECMPICDFIGSRSEGWYNSCTGELIAWDMCSQCEVSCKRSADGDLGWQNSCTNEILVEGSCSGEWDCLDNPEELCQVGPNPCEAIAEGICTGTGQSCPENYRQSQEFPCPGSDVCCVPGEATNDCESDGGFCVRPREGCPEGSDAVYTSCGANNLMCCMKSQSSRCEDNDGVCIADQDECRNGMIAPDLECRDGTICCQTYQNPDCLEAGGLCYQGSDWICPEGYQSTSGVLYECGHGSFCCFPANENSCETAGGMCIGWSPSCPEGTITYPAVGCPDYAGACCLPENGVYCNWDGECGATRCEQQENGACLETIPYCQEGNCSSESKTYNFAICENDGRCHELVGGECQPGEMRYVECPNGQSVPWCRCDEDGEWVCDGAPEEACVNVELQQCEQLGGQCASWYGGCPVGTASVPASCGDLICAGGCLCCLATP